MQGSNRFLGEYPNIPEKYQAAMRRGYNFFELRFPNLTKYPKMIMGPFDILVRESQHPVTHRITHDTRYLTGLDAQVRYEVPNPQTGIAIAFLVDDEFWHNRVIMMDNPGFDVFNYHMPDGIIPGAIIKREIECLRDVLCYEVPVYHAVSPRGPVKSSNEEKEIDTFLLARPDLRKAITKAKVKKPEIAAMIQRYSNNEYGWTNNLEFKERIIPQVEALYLERGISRSAVGGSAPVSQGAIEDAVKKVLKGLTPDTLQALQAQIKQEEAVPALDDDDVSFGEEAEEAFAPPLAREAQGNPPLMKLSKEQLITKADELGIPNADTLTKPLLVKAISQALKSKPETDEELIAQ